MAAFTSEVKGTVTITEQTLRELQVAVEQAKQRHQFSPWCNRTTAV